QTERSPTSAAAPSSAHRVPPAFLELAKNVACHRSPSRWDDLYRLLWRLTHGEPRLLDVATDDDVHLLQRQAKQVTRDAHKAKAFVRFRRVETPEGDRYVAWHRPDHRILPLVAPFFSRRFKEMHWTVLTPDASVTWDGEELHYGPGTPQAEAPAGDALEELWRTYYAGIFNPARIKLKMMKREMPVRHWATLPETRIIPELLDDAPRRVEAMLHYARGAERGAAAYLPTERDLASLAAAAAGCQGCELHSRATQTVFGVGNPRARLVLIGEQPGDQEDRVGTPFIGPAGEVLSGALEEAGLAREDVYLTNAVKHFHWTPRGTRRLHQRPPARAEAACKPWLEAELAAIGPRALVCLGATAAQAVLGRSSGRAQQRGVWQTSKYCERTLVTWHPAAILRAPDEIAAARMQHELIEHLLMAEREVSS
ncbi:MAG: UdgX family uracil-DNA binding protein, partial [Planctomycetes bacterium]|nr:UdgX family uracil-DNA binding protein [Planctomycetota bacterium]